MGYVSLIVNILTMGNADKHEAFLSTTTSGSWAEHWSQVQHSLFYGPGSIMFG